MYCRCGLLCAALVLSGIFLADAAMLEQDLSALVAFRNATDPSNLLGWSTQRDPCSWQGITCINATIGSSNGSVSEIRERVFKINLPGVGISGAVPAGVLGSLDELMVLSLRSNLLSGPLPGDLIKCRKLRSLVLQRNRFTGPITWDFQSWPRLVRVDLSYNTLNGSLPQSLEGLPRIKIFLVQNNSFTGKIPAIQRGSSIVDFSVANNSLSGQIPQTLAQLPPQDFSGNLDLCGRPLGFVCSAPASPEPTPSRPAAPTQTKPGRRLSLGAILALVIGDVAFLAVLTTLFMLCYWHKQHKREISAASARSPKPKAEVSSSDDFTREFSSSDKSAEAQAGQLVFLKTSKNNFSLEDLLRASAEMMGQGSLGTSYRAVLEDGQMVAVKRIKGVELGSKEFEKRMAVFGEIEHQNLHVPRAYYFSKTEKLVVTEFIPMGSLAAQLHGGETQQSISLDWSMRLRIALGAARGIACLHESLGGQVVHGDIKSSNILLSRSMEARVADYGIAQMLGPGSESALGPVGYRAPELSATRKLTQQSDVYAFGVVLLEILTGKAPWRSNHSGEMLDLPRWVQSVVREEWTEEVFDQGILRFSEEEMVEMLQIALVCVATLPGDRPKMRNVVKMIEDVRNWGTGGEELSSEELKSMDRP
ncbi:probable inactive receptor kinase At2g26730 [Selaginella moellendorffii]|nr:probable inactive receptor kinase At2g26730 [Selaginella moellendorffii]|eukprot:XP_002994180.2 probable inactive receptor kinase At2g26730 [Selaginella moellendorffii]